MSLAKPAVVVDSSAFICLEQEPAYFSYFTRLFTQVFIPEQVAKELVSKQLEPPESYLASHNLQGIVKIVAPVSLEDFISLHRPPFGLGEAAVISLAFQKRCAAVIEEKRGRNFANRHGVVAANMAAFAVRGYRQGYIAQHEAEEMVETMWRVNMFGNKLRSTFLDDIADFSG